MLAKNSISWFQMGSPSRKIPNGYLAFFSKTAHHPKTEEESLFRVHVLLQLFFFFFSFLLPLTWPLLQHMEILRLRVELELPPQAYVTATATPDP